MAKLFDHYDCTCDEIELYEQLKAFSEEGWELVSSLKLDRDYNNILLIFKKPTWNKRDE